MAKPKWNTEWKVPPHQPLIRLEDNLMVVEAPLRDVPINRRMTVVRLDDGRLVIHSAIALDDASMARLEAWGTPAFLIVPNHFHRMDALVYRERYPEMVVIAGPTGRKKIERAVPVDGGPELLPAGLGLEGEPLDGSKVGEMAFLVTHRDRRTLVLTDAMFNVPRQRGFGGFVLWVLGSSGALKVTRLMRWFGVEDLEAFRAHLRRLAETPGLARLIVSHGAIIEDEVAERMRRALA